MNRVQKYRFALLLIFLTALSHQCLQKGFHIQMPWIDAYLDDILCMPLFLAVWAWERDFLFKMKPLGLAEIIYFTFFIFLLFEFVIPKISVGFTSDWWDGLAYGLGSVIYCAIQPSEMRPSKTQGIENIPHCQPS